MTIIEILRNNPMLNGESKRAYARRMSVKEGLNFNTVKKNIIYKYAEISSCWNMPEIFSDKVQPDLTYEEIIAHVKNLQKITNKSKKSQDFAKWNIKSDDDIYVIFLGDTHIGSMGSDIEAFERITNEILTIPNLFVVLLGDLTEMAINMRSVLEVTSQTLSPKMQHLFLDMWLDKIKHKVICATWDNHNVMREEKVLGFSPTADALSKRVIYHNGIGEIDINVNDINYRLGLSHMFRGNSIYNPNHAQGRYVRNENCNLDIIAQGDKHVPSFQNLYISGAERILIQCGTLNKKSGYAKRFYSLRTMDDMPVVRLNHKEKEITPYMTLKKARI